MSRLYIVTLLIYAEYIVQNAGLDDSQAGIKMAGRNISKHRYADDTTLMAESEEELKSLLTKVKEESEKDGLKLNIGKTIALTRWAFVSKVMSLPFNRLCRLVIAFLPRSKCLLISWLH